MPSELQCDLFEHGLIEQFEAWKRTPGGAEVMRIAYAIAAGYARRLRVKGRRVSMKLIWEQLRDNVVYIRARKKQFRIGLDKLDGFALNNNFHAYVARHILEHKPDWRGLFELRELAEERRDRQNRGDRGAQESRVSFGHG